MSFCCDAKIKTQNFSNCPMDVRDNAIIIRSINPSRLGWDKAFAQMTRLGDDAMLQDDSKASKWDAEEWEWK